MHTLNSPYRATAIYERGGVRSRPLSLLLSLAPVSLSPSWFSMRTDFLENNEFPSFLMACANVVSAPSPFHPVPSLTTWLNSSSPPIPCHFNWFDLLLTLSSNSMIVVFMILFTNTVVFRWSLCIYNFSEFIWIYYASWISLSFIVEKCISRCILYINRVRSMKRQWKVIQ